MRLRQAEEADLAFIEAVERKPEYEPFILRWSLEQHLAAFHDPDTSYLIFAEKAGGAPEGYAILSGLTSPNDAVLLQRLALAEAGRGRGRACCLAVMEHVFETLGAHRFHLDLFEANDRAAHLYRACGFEDEGLLRDAVRKDGRYLSLRLMALLRPDYEALKREGRLG